MAIYVDRESNVFGRMKMSHMIADTLDELHKMAEMLGLKHEWFQPESIPHYDISQSKRRLAISFGAIEIDRRAMVELIHKQRKVATESSSYC